MALDEHAQKRLDALNEAKRKSQEEFQAKTKGRPTPTQDELDRINMGENVIEKEPDGADPDEGSMPVENRQMHASGSGGGYRTRQATPQQSSPRATYPAGQRSSTHET